MPKGQIIRTQSNFYYVKDNQEKLWECKARGLFKYKKKQITPLVGDFVEFDSVDTSSGYIIDIEPRKNEMIRPQIANVDQVILVFSLKSPEFSSLLLDKFIVHVEKANITPIICITKADLNDNDEEIQMMMRPYVRAGYSIIKTSAKAQKGLDELKSILKNKITVFSGQSGVGKSSLVNAIIPNSSLETNEISKKLGRGKHTTRFVQLIELPEGGMVADTPGFSQLDFRGIGSEELDELFIDIAPYNSSCRFRGCLHENEPGCAVKEAVEKNELDAGRYEHYLEFLKILKENEANKWR